MKRIMKLNVLAFLSSVVSAFAAEREVRPFLEVQEIQPKAHTFECKLNPFINSDEVLEKFKNVILLMHTGITLEPDISKIFEISVHDAPQTHVGIYTASARDSVSQGLDNISISYDAKLVKGETAKYALHQFAVTQRLQGGFCRTRLCEPITLYSVVVDLDNFQVTFNCHAN